MTDKTTVGHVTFGPTQPAPSAQFSAVGNVLGVIKFDCGKHDQVFAGHDCPFCNIERLRGALGRIRFAGNNSHPTAIWMQLVAAHAMDDRIPDPGEQRAAEQPSAAPQPKYEMHPEGWLVRIGETDQPYDADEAMAAFERTRAKYPNALRELSDQPTVRQSSCDSRGWHRISADGEPRNPRCLDCGFDIRLAVANTGHGIDVCGGPRVCPVCAMAPR